MVFSSISFLFLFLPLVLWAYFVVRPGLRNALLIAASAVYYAWSESQFLRVVLASAAANYLFGLCVHPLVPKPARKLALASAVLANVGLLAWYKYANFTVETLNHAAMLLKRPGWQVHLAHVTLPLGISFFTFHALSYVIDVYRSDARPQPNFALLALYLLFFPQLVAGPIVRYHELEHQLRARSFQLARFARGVERFLIGLAKKVLIANQLGPIADGVFGLATRDLTPGIAWLGAVSYALQIYFDFSGYSDMALGLAALFGFEFPENFDYPYIARSLTDFWRRWHLSLSRWFRDYLYLPLGGNRRGAARTYVNLVIVFFCCGLWHGASFTFVIWGLFHGAFLVLERAGFSKILARLPSLLQRGYCLFVVLVGWVIFRASSLGQASDIIAALFGMAHGAGTAWRAAAFVDPLQLTTLVAGVIFSAPLGRLLRRPWLDPSATTTAFGPALELARVALILALGAVSAMHLSATTYNPFIYFRF